MANRDDDRAREAFRKLEDQRQAHVSAGTQPPAALLNQLSRSADDLMARAKAAHGEN